MHSITLYKTKEYDTMAQFERNAIEKHRRLICEEYKLSVEIEAMRAANDIINHVKSCPSCGSKLYRHSCSKPTPIETLSGVVNIRLPRLRCSNNECNKLITVGKQLLPNNNLSALLAEKICDLASKMSYAQVSQSLEIQHNLIVPQMRCWKIIQSESAIMTDQPEHYKNKLYATGEAPPVISEAKTLFIGIDGGHLKGWKSSPGFESKAVTFATGVKNAKLQNRVGYAKNCSGEEFCQIVSTIGFTLGLLSATRVIVVSDGAKWIHNGVDDWIPGAIHLLDIFHLKRKIYGLFLKNAEGADTTVRDNAIRAVNEYDPGKIIRALKQWTPYNDRKREALEDLIGYIKYNSKQIENHKSTRIHGSGMIEKGVDLMISRRLKLRQMGWTICGSTSMLKLKVLQYNNNWNEYWMQRQGALGLAA